MAVKGRRKGSFFANSISAAAFTGMGFTSQNSSFISHRYRSCSSAAVFVSPFSAATALTSTSGAARSRRAARSNRRHGRRA